MRPTRQGRLGEGRAKGRGKKKRGWESWEEREGREKKRGKREEESEEREKER